MNNFGISRHIHQIEVSPKLSVALHEIRLPETNKPIVLLVHGSIENGKIFYSKNGKGLAFYLAQNGFHSWVVDLPGKGSSKPKIKKGFRSGMIKFIESDMVKIMQFIAEQTGGKYPTIAVGHSWGGVLINSFYAQHGAAFPFSHIIHFGNKRKIQFNNIEKILKISVVWHIIGSIMKRFYGYVPFKRFKIGVENEPWDFHSEMVPWIYSDQWKNSSGFDYSKAIQELPKPSILNLVGENDHALGASDDSIRFIHECGWQSNTKHIVLGKSNRFKRNYDHNEMLVHSMAKKEIFPLVLKFLHE